MALSPSNLPFEPVTPHLVSSRTRLFLGDHLILAAIPWYVVDACCLDSRYYLLRQDALNLRGVHSCHVSFEALIPSNPAFRCISDGDKALEDLRCAVVDVLGITGELKKLFAIGAAAVPELCVGAHDGADHAGAQVALLVRWDEGAPGDHVGCHFGGGFVEGRV